MTVTAQAVQKIWQGEDRMTHEMGLQTFPKKQTLLTPTWRFCGTVFQSREAATGKVRSTMVEKQVLSDDKRWRRRWWW